MSTRLAPVKLSEYSVMDNNWYAFEHPGRADLRAAEQLVATAAAGRSRPPRTVRTSSAAARAQPRSPIRPATVFAVAGAAKPLPPGSRISYQTVSCGNDGVTTTCVDSRNQSGFVLSPAGSFIFDEVQPAAGPARGHQPVHQLTAAALVIRCRSEPCAVHLVAGLLGGQAAVGVFDGGAVVDDAVDLARDRH